jgi:hypothetical protein
VKLSPFLEKTNKQTTPVKEQSYSPLNTKSETATTAAFVAKDIVSITSSTVAVHAYSTYLSRALTSALRDTRNSKQEN